MNEKRGRDELQTKGLRVVGGVSRKEEEKSLD